MVDLSMCTSVSIQVTASIIPFIRILKTRRTSGFSMESQLCYIIAFSFKYLNYPVPRPDTSAELITMHSLQFWIRAVLAVVMLITFFASANVKGYFEKETNAFWLCGGLIASSILAADISDYDERNSAKMICTSGSYLDVITLVPQFKLTLKKMHIDLWLLLYIIGLFAYDCINMGNISHDYYRNFVSGDMRIKFSLLKIFLVCGFLVRYCHKQLIRRVESMNEIVCENCIANEVTVVSSAEEYADKMLFRTLGMEDVLVNGRLMSPY